MALGLNLPLMFALLTALALALLLLDRDQPRSPSLLSWLAEREAGRGRSTLRPAAPTGPTLWLGPALALVGQLVRRLGLALGLIDPRQPDQAPRLSALGPRLALGLRWAAIFAIVNIGTTIIGLAGGRVPFSLPWVVPLAVFALGFAVAGIDSGRLARQHRESVQAGLPGLLDLLVLTLAAGQGLEEGLKRAAESGSGGLATELQTLLRAYNTRGDSLVAGLNRLAERLGLPDLHALATTIDLADRQGTHLLEPLTKLREDLYAAELRGLKRLSERKTWAMLFPVALLTLPATLLIVLIPAGSQVLTFVARR